ncbi:CAP domain-containing protein [Actinoplanes sp. NPDC023801]|uniref:CAP domain-containing protein n=1 Tax=Actinoplanes sp. NPDC023801 TaxID=3154595 RepID=UPI0033D2B9FB
MRQILRRLAVAALLAPAAAAAAATMIASPAGAAPAKVSEQVLQDEVNRLTNVERVKGGCAALTVDARLTAAARGHSAWMARTGTFSHTGSGGSDFVSRVKTAGHAAPASENIAWSYRTAAQVTDAWMKSPGHRANILNCAAKSVGTGVAYAANGKPYYTQNFGS